MRAGTMLAVILLVASCKGEEASKAKPFQAAEPRPEAAPPPSAAAPEAGAPATAPAARAARLGPELGPAPAALSAKLELRKVADGFRRPVALESAPGDGADVLYVVEQVGRIWRLEGGVKGSAPVFDIRREVSRANEQGLLGLAFHPEFATNRKLYVNYTDTEGSTNVVEYQLPAGASSIDLSTKRLIFKVRQPFANHNAGDLEFGSDGKLYVGLGDGGAGGDPMGAGQDDDNVLGKILRIDVDAPEVARDIVVKGVRNPWRYAFDAKTGDLYIGDVGQDKWEEIDVLAKDRIAGTNLGWNTMEGTHCFKPASGCKKDGITLPVVEYSHREGCSVTGGEVYRGKALADELDGVYFYADYCEPYLVRSFRWTAADGIGDHWEWTDTLNRGKKVKDISSFGHDADGELYVVSLDGGIYVLARR